MSLCVVVVPITPTSPATVIGLSVGLGGGLFVIILAMFVYWCVRRSRDAAASGDNTLVRRLVGADSEA